MASNANEPVLNNDDDQYDLVEPSVIHQNEKKQLAEVKTRSYAATSSIPDVFAGFKNDQSGGRVKPMSFTPLWNKLQYPPGSTLNEKTPIPEIITTRTGGKRKRKSRKKRGVSSYKIEKGIIATRVCMQFNVC